MYSSDNDDSIVTDATPMSPQSAEIYHRVNSLFDGDKNQLSSSDNDQNVFSSMWGLNTPRGPFLNHSNTSNSNSSLPQSPVGFGRRKFMTSSPFNNNYYYRQRPFPMYEKPVNNNWFKYDWSEDDLASPSPLRSFQRTYDSGFHSTPNSPLVMRKNSYSNRYNEWQSPMGESFMNSSTRSLSPPESMTSSSGFTECGYIESDLGLQGSMSSLNLQSPLVSSNPLSYQMQRQVDHVAQSTMKLLHQQVQIVNLLQRVNAGGPPAMVSPPVQQMHNHLSDNNGNSLEKAALVHRNAAGVFEASYTWEGVLPPHTTDKNSVFSCKVFLGGVPWEISEDTIEQAFAPYGPVRVVWPGKEQMVSQPKGFAYLIFESEKKLKALLSNCVKDFANGGTWFYRISSRRMKAAKEVEVIPWAIVDCNYAETPVLKLDPQKTVFVGALHGQITAEGLATVMNDLFGCVLHAGIDTDKHKYPIGSARVSFSSTKSYMKAVAAAFIEIKTDKFSKTIQVDPYLEDSFCSGCKIQQGPYFCREMICFRYFCRQCWMWHHAPENMKNHNPLMRNSKNRPIIGFGSANSPLSNHF